MTKTTNFLNQIKPGAIAGWEKYKILPSVTAAQAALESAWGTSKLALPPNHNLFGIKGSYKGESVQFPTWEVIHGENVTVNASFRKYPNWSVSVEDHGSFFHENSRYHRIIGLTDFVLQARGIHEAGYATDPAYANKLIATIEANGLRKWDEEALSGLAISPSPEVSLKSYTVQSGDNLSTIAKRFGTTVANLVAKNSLSNPDLIYPGQVLHISEPEETLQYIVQPGDSLSAISVKLGISMDELIRKNQIKNPNLIYAGEVLTY